MSTILIQGIVAFVATWAFAMLFDVPRQQYIPSGITGAAGWVCYLLCTAAGMSMPMASFFAALMLTGMARVFSIARCCPVTVFLICGIFPLVPGAGIYYTAYHFIMSENALAVSKGIETLKVAVAIALGIVAVLSLPMSIFRLFAVQRKTKK